MSKIFGDEEELTDEDAAIVKGMLDRGDHNHHVASFFGVNQRAISDIRTGKKFRLVQAHALGGLPPPGPYLVDQNFVKFYKAVARVNELWDAGDMKKAKSLFERALRSPLKLPSQNSMEATLDELLRDDLGRLQI